MYVVTIIACFDTRVRLDIVRNYGCTTQEILSISWTPPSDNHWLHPSMTEFTLRTLLEGINFLDVLFTVKPQDPAFNTRIGL